MVEVIVGDDQGEATEGLFGVSRIGTEIDPTPPEDIEDVRLWVFPQMRGQVGKERAAQHWRHLFADHFPKAVIGGLVELARAWRPDIVVGDDTNFGACIAAERLGIPNRAVQWVAFRPNLYELIKEPLNDRRCEACLPPDGPWVSRRVAS